MPSSRMRTSAICRHGSRRCSAGEKINLSEGRPVLHTALRQQDDTPLLVDGNDVVAQIRAAQARVRTLASQVRGGLRLGASGRPLRHVIAIGIGGSDLGPQARLRCARPAAEPTRRRRRRRVRLQRRSRAPDARTGRARSGDDLVHRDLEDIHDRRNARQRACGARVAGARAGRRRRAWRALRRDHQQRRGGARVRRRGNRHTADLGLGRWPLFALVAGRTADRDSLRLGRLSRSSSPAPPASIAHFRETPLERNLPVLLALVDFWNARMLGYPQRIVAPYAEALKLLPSYLQQLTLESNGKSVLRDGSPVDGPTAPALWGGPGTDGQHAYFQWLHQGTSTAAVEFIVPVRAAHPLGEQQALLVANALAQAQALMRGRSLDEARSEVARAAKDAAPASADALAASRVCPGNRPSTTLLLPELNARRLGQLIALVRAPDLCRRRAAGHQFVRSMGRRAGQSAGRAAFQRAEERRRAARRRCIDARSGCARQRAESPALGSPAAGVLWSLSAGVAAGVASGRIGTSLRVASPRAATSACASCHTAVA